MANSDVNVLQTVIQLRRGTEEQWNLVKDAFVPREGEPCTTIYDDGRDALIKIGDGKHTWGQLGYTRDSFLVTVTIILEPDYAITADKTREEILKAVEQNKYVYVRLLGPKEALGAEEIFLPFLGSSVGNGNTLLFFNGGVYVYFFSNGLVYVDTVEYMATSELTNYNFDAQDKSIVNLKDDIDLTSAVTRRYTDNSTPIFLSLEETDGVIKSKFTDVPTNISTLRTILTSQTFRGDESQYPYKAIKCYAVLDGNCYDLVYSSKESSQEAGKNDTVKRTFFAITSNGLTKLSVLIDENNNVTWTKEAQGVATEQFVVTVTKVGEHDTWESDKTPAEIAASSQAGKQVVLKRQWQSKTEAAYLVSVTDERADFCFIGSDTNTDLEQDFPISGDMFEQEWVTITADKAAKIHREAHSPVFMIQKVGDDCVSAVSPYNFLNASFWGPASNVYLFEDGEILSGVVVQTSEENSTNYFHIYFPNYAKNKLYDLKWNKDVNPSTYTFTESVLGAEGSMIVNFTVTDILSFTCTADKTFAEVDAAYKKGIPIYGRVALDDQQGFLSCSHEIGGNYNFTGLAIKSNFTMAINYTSTGCKAYLGQIMWKNFLSSDDAIWDADNFRIGNVGSPTSDTDAATKGYADNVLTSAKAYADNILTAGNSDSVVIKSSTPDSIKKFRITVDDAGTISATEVT